MGKGNKIVFYITGLKKKKQQKKKKRKKGECKMSDMLTQMMESDGILHLLNSKLKI